MSTQTAQRTVADVVPGAERELVRYEEDGLDVLEYCTEDTCVGYVCWNFNSGTIDGIEVTEEFRRRGIATALWFEALTLCPHLRHDSDSELTDDGHAWARAVGGENAPTISRVPL